MDCDRLGGHPLADGGIFILEETVKKAAAGSPVVAHTHEAYQFGRVDFKVSRLLRDYAERAEYGGVVNLVTHRFPLEEINEALKTNLSMQGLKIAIVNR